MARVEGNVEQWAEDAEIAVIEAFAVEVPPPRHLRSRILAEARRRRPPVSRAYAEQVAELDGLLADLSGSEWRAPVPRHGDVRGVVAHLQANSASALRTRADRGSRDVLAQRVFETWIHTDDVRLATGRPVAVTPHLSMVVDMAVRLLPSALPGARGTVRIDLTGAVETSRLVAFEAPTKEPRTILAMDAEEFCRLCANRRSPLLVRCSVEGDRAFARTVLQAASTLGCDE